MIFIKQEKDGRASVICMEDAEATRMISKNFPEPTNLGAGVTAWNCPKSMDNRVYPEIIFTGTNAAGRPVSIPDVDIALERCFRVCRYEQVDEEHNVWRCRRCNHLEQFEADGPFENGWKRCPVCSRWILEPEDMDTLEDSMSEDI